MPTVAPRLVTLLLTCLLLTACGVEPSAPPGRVQELLGLVPATVARERPLYYTDLRVARAFSSVLPLAASGQVLGVPVEALTDILETGGVPLTLLAGDVDPEEVAAAVEARGYRVERGEGWLRFEREELAGEMPPLVVAVPAGAARDGLVVLGSPGDVDAVLASEAPAAWAEPLARTVGAAAAIAFDGRDAPLASAVQRYGTDVEGLLSRYRVSGSLDAYEAAAISWTPHGEFDGMRVPAGMVALHLSPNGDGHEQAAALAIRAATAPILGDTRRAMQDIVEGGAPRFDENLGTVRLPIRWIEFDARQLRQDLDGGNLLFLAPGSPS